MRNQAIHIKKELRRHPTPNRFFMKILMGKGGAVLWLYIFLCSFKF